MKVRQNKANQESLQAAGQSIDPESATPNNIVPFKGKVINSSSMVPEFAITLKEAKKRVDMLKKFVEELMVPGVDYGLVTGSDQPTLLKPGSEKLCDVFGFTKKVDVINRLEDWYHGIFHYEVKVTLINKSSGMVEAQGVGCCNSRESAYKEQSGYDVVNTILKVAKKRALIDAVLTATRSSDIFTQDVEEMEWLWNKGTKGNNIHPVSATRKQLSYIFSIVEEKMLPVEAIKAAMQERYSVTESRQLSVQQASDFIEYLKTQKQYKEVQNKELPTDLCK